MKILKIDETYGKRTITIKDPRLRKIRNSLREIIGLWKRSVVLSLQAFREEISYDENGEFRSNLSGEEIEKLRKLNDKIEFINTVYSNSICKCHRCPRIDQDMTYNPRNGAWYCVKCYEEMHRWTAKKKTGKSSLFP